VSSSAAENIAARIAAKYPLAGTMTIAGRKYRLREPVDGDARRLVAALETYDLAKMREALEAQFEGDAPDLSRAGLMATAQAIHGLLTFWHRIMAKRVVETARIVKLMAARLEELGETAGRSKLAPVQPREGDNGSGSAGGGDAGAAERGGEAYGSRTAFVAPQSQLSAFGGITE
jgi:hypothetical protein